MSDMCDVPTDREVEQQMEEEEEVVTDLQAAIPKVLKKALAHDGLCRGLHEVAKALDAKRVKCCFIAASCSEKAYVSLVQALCKENKVPLIPVTEAKLLGEWAGLCKIDKEGNARKVVGASCVAVVDVGEESPALAFLKEHIRQMK